MVRHRSLERTLIMNHHIDNHDELLQTLKDSIESNERVYNALQDMDKKMDAAAKRTRRNMVINVITMALWLVTATLLFMARP